jgi:hypothetical protein
MKTTITRDATSCDGCEYLIGSDVPTIVVTVRGEQFDFHDGGQGQAERHDCFRYWAHGPNIMKRSLLERGWNEEAIDEFLSLMLYRKDGLSPGVTRPKAKGTAA